MKSAYYYALCELSEQGYEMRQQWSDGNRPGIVMNPYAVLNDRFWDLHFSSSPDWEEEMKREERISAWEVRQRDLMHRPHNVWSNLRGWLNGYGPDRPWEF